MLNQLTDGRDILAANCSTFYGFDTRGLDQAGDEELRNFMDSKKASDEDRWY